MPRIILTPQNVRDAIRDTADTPAAARLLGVSDTAVYSAARQWGIAIKPKSKRRIDYSQWPETPPYPPKKACSQWRYDLWATARSGASFEEMEARFNRPAKSLEVTLHQMRAGRPAVAERAAAAGVHSPQPAPAAASALSSHAHKHAEESP